MPKRKSHKRSARRKCNCEELKSQMHTPGSGKAAAMKRIYAINAARKCSCPLKGGKKRRRKRR